MLRGEHTFQANPLSSTHTLGMVVVIGNLLPPYCVQCVLAPSRSWKPLPLPALMLHPSNWEKWAGEASWLIIQSGCCWWRSSPAFEETVTFHPFPRPMGKVAKVTRLTTRILAPRVMSVWCKGTWTWKTKRDVGGVAIICRNWRKDDIVWSRSVTWELLATYTGFSLLGLVPVITVKALAITTIHYLFGKKEILFRALYEEIAKLTLT